MKIKPKLSVIVPTYNEEENIKNTLIAIKNQRCNIPYEIIVSDGQSTDKTVSIASNYAKVYVSPNKGKALQCNYAVTKSSGDILIFIDADTIVTPLFLNKMYKIFEKDKKLFVCSARVKYHNGKVLSFNIGSIKYTITTCFFLNFGMHIWYLLKMFLGYPELSGSNIIVRRDIYLRVGGFKQLPSKMLGIDKVFSDSMIYLRRKMKRGKIKTLSFLSVMTSGRSLSSRRSFKRISDYHLKKEIFYNLAKDNNLSI